MDDTQGRRILEIDPASSCGTGSHDTTQLCIAALEDCIRRGAKGLLKDVELFDIYRGTNIPAGKKSVAFSLTLRADDRSLTAEEADEDVKNILSTLESELGAVLR